MIRCQTAAKLGRLAAPAPDLPPLSISEVSTLTAGFADDLRAYAAGGFDAIGIWEMKLEAGRDAEALEALRASGLGAASAVPAVPSIMPLPRLAGPDTPRARVDAILRSLERLAPFAPSAVVCFTGPGGTRALVVRSLRQIARAAEGLGLRIALEPFQPQGGDDWSEITSLGAAADLIDEIGSPAVGIQFDVWHLWNAPDLAADIAAYAHLLAGVHVNDWRAPTRGWADRVLPGDGIADVPSILAALEEAGWAGYYDIEIFSDNGAFGDAYPDSLWDLEPDEFVRRSRASFSKCWSARKIAA